MNEMSYTRPKNLPDEITLHNEDDGAHWKVRRDRGHAQHTAIRQAKRVQASKSRRHNRANR